MRLLEVEKRAKSLGIKDTWKYSKKDLIRAIQRKEGNFSCFGTATSGNCDQQGCCWRQDCLH
ncbi:MAG: SAP domain-containing protein [Candidatus Omnitrophica bacterium]|nr:SAP domain-containing protein [Candidatus Omnitrophota bacterium]